MDSALRILGVRDHSRLELEQKLGARGFDQDEIALTVEKLQSYGYLDDAKFAALLVKSHSNLGRRALLDRLRRKGITDDVAHDVLEGIDEDEEFSRALTAGRKHSPLHKISSLPRQVWQRRLGAFLARRGFSAHTSLSVCKVLEEELQEREAELDGGPNYCLQ